MACAGYVPQTAQDGRASRPPQASGPRRPRCFQPVPEFMADYTTTSTSYPYRPDAQSVHEKIETEELVNMISEANDPILSAVQENMVKVAADTGVCAHCIGPDDLLDGMIVKQVPERNFAGPDGNGIEHVGEAGVRFQQTQGNHVNLTSRVFEVTPGPTLRAPDLRQGAGYALHQGYGPRGAEGSLR